MDLRPDKTERWVKRDRRMNGWLVWLVVILLISWALIAVILAAT